MAEELRVAKHFPKVLKPCKDVAKPFFDCFSTNSVQPEGGDADAGRKALAKCVDEMQAYDACMVKHMPKHGTLYRVPEAYRER